MRCLAVPPHSTPGSHTDACIVLHPHSLTLIHRLLKESQRQLQVPYQSSEDEDFDSPPDLMAAAAAVAAAATTAAAAAMQQPLPLPPPGTPPLIYGRHVAIHSGPDGTGAAAPFGPLPDGVAAAAAGTATAPAAATAGSSGGAAAAAAAVAVGQQQQQYYAPGSSLGSLDGSCSVGGQWPAGEASGSGSGRSGCPVYVMLPLDTVWVVERETQKVSTVGGGRGGGVWRWSWGSSSSSVMRRGRVLAA